MLFRRPFYLPLAQEVDGALAKIQQVLDAFSLTPVNLDHIRGVPTEDPLSGLLLAQRIKEAFAEDAHQYISVKALKDTYLVPFLVDRDNNLWYHARTLMDRDAKGEISGMLHGVSSNPNRALFVRIGRRWTRRYEQGSS